MARPVEFDRDQALEQAMSLFWRQGYAATSLCDLLEAMAIGRSSFYAAFEDKRSLFIEALGLFSDRTRGMVVEASTGRGPIEAVRRFFVGTLLEVPRARAGRGCMMVNTILELADVDAELSAMAARELARVEAVFESCFGEAQRSGDFRADRSASELAAHVMLINQGLRVASRTRASRKVLECQIETALGLLGASAA